MVIHRNSKHPVQVKKIALKLWLLRDEIEAVIKNRLIYTRENNLECDVSDIKKEYSNTDDNSFPSPDSILKTLQNKPNNNEVKSDVSSTPTDSLETSENIPEEIESKNEITVPEEIESKSEITVSEENKAENSDTDNKSQDDLEKKMETSLAEPVEEEVKEDNSDIAVSDDLEKAMIASLDEPIKNLDIFEEKSSTFPIETISNSIKVYQRALNLNEEKISNGKTLLSEIYMDQIYLFADKHFFEGQSIVIEFVIPKKFTLNAKVLFCAKYNLKNRIISKYNLSYRVCAQFTFIKKGEKTLLRQFLTSVEPDIRNEKEVKKVVKEDESIDNILDGLDL